ncbi:MAG: DegT/DnrJ/EryC1/StrS family aminotransferase [Dongiaceae bacterium]
MNARNLKRVEAVAGPIAFIDLQAQRTRLGGRIERAIARVLDHGIFVLGPEVAELERALAAFSGAAHAVTCANGTDALQLALMSEGIGRGDAVLLPSFNFTAAAEAVVLAGAEPVFVDVGARDFNIDPASVAATLDRLAAEGGPRPRMVVAVDMFGQPADYAALAGIAGRHGLKLLADAAQSFGAVRDGRRVGTLGQLTTVSFYPAKPLGCYGDGGAVLTDDAERAALLRSLRLHGQGTDKYDHPRVGMNSRLDTLQAAILIEKLQIFAEEIEARQRVAERYDSGLAGCVAVPAIAPGVRSVWAQYTVISERRDRIVAALREDGIPTAIHYPLPLHRQLCYAGCRTAPGGLPVSERLARQVVSLPMHAYLEPETQDRIIAAVQAALA